MAPCARSRQRPSASTSAPPTSRRPSSAPTAPCTPSPAATWWPRSTATSPSSTPRRSGRAWSTPCGSAWPRHPTPPPPSSPSASTASTRPSSRSGPTARPVAMMRLWSDRRGTERSFAILEDDDAFFGFIERHGIPPVGGGLSLGHILHLQHDCPEIHAETAAYLEPMDYLNARLTGRIAANQATQFMSQLIDNRSLGQTSYDDVLVGWAGVDTSRLPELLPLDEPIGAGAARRRRAARHPRRPPSSTPPSTTPRPDRSPPTPTDRAGPGCPSARRRCWSTRSPPRRSTSTTRCCRAPARSTTATCCSPRTAWAASRSSTCSTTSSTPAASTRSTRCWPSVPAGSGGVLFLPWLRGSMAPANDTNMRGGYVNMSLDTDRRCLVRATCEGVAHNLAWLLPARRSAHRQPRRRDRVLRRRRPLGRVGPDRRRRARPTR